MHMVIGARSTEYYRNTYVRNYVTVPKDNAYGQVVVKIKITKDGYEKTVEGFSRSQYVNSDEDVEDLTNNALNNALGRSQMGYGINENHIQWLSIGFRQYVNYEKEAETMVDEDTYQFKPIE